MDSITQLPGSGPSEPENMQYFTPKQIWHRYCRSYSTFMKRLNDIVREGEYREGAFRVIPQQDVRKRPYNQFEIHPVWGIEVLDRYFSARNAR
jgi:hypothetical protein